MASVDERGLQLHARIAGFLFLFYIAAVAGGDALAGSYIAPDHWQITSNLGYRGGVLLQLLGGMSAIPLGYSLYVLLRPVDRGWALVGVVWRSGEGVLNTMSCALMFAGANLLAGRGPGATAADRELTVRLLQSVPNAVLPMSILFFSF